jgi:glycosyltransferase involved in cell wall biosynthesis
LTAAPSYPLKILALTGGRDVPSARYRVRQFISPLQGHGICLTERIPSIPGYPPDQKWKRPLWGGAALLERLPSALRSHRYDATLLQRELLSTLVTLEPWTKRPRILDVDDAIFIHRGGAAARWLAEMADLVICGNDYLAERFAQWNSKVAILPTAVDTARFLPHSKGASERMVIGWIGTSGNFPYLQGIERAVTQVLKSHPHAVFRVVADRPPRFTMLSPDQVEFIRWRAENEVENIQAMTIGLMPLVDSAWTRGKCSFKLLQYMACGIPVVASPVGMNRQVLALGPAGLSALSDSDWIHALETLLEDESLRKAMGQVGRDIAVREFSVIALAPRFAYLLRKTAFI